MDSEQWLRQRRAFDRTLYTLRNMRRPIFAAVNGRAVGGGSEFAQSCDFIIAAENASFCQPEALVGISAGADRRGSSRANSLPDMRCIN